MSAKKNLSAKDLSEKFGVPVSEKDLTSENKENNRGLNRLGDLSELNVKENFQDLPEEVPAPMEEKNDPEDEKSFAELFESRGVVLPGESVRMDESPKRTENRFVCEEETDFGKLFNLSKATVEDKDSVALSDEDSAPFELADGETDGNGLFHGFQDLPGERKGKKRR